MIYYTSSLKKVLFDPSKEPIGPGTQGTVYDFDADKCIKIYGEDVQKYDNEIFGLFKELSLVGYCKLYDLLYSDPSLKNIAAYTMKKYLNEVDNILNIPT